VSALVLSLFCSTSIEIATAFPNGAGLCRTDGPSVGGPHLAKTPLVNSSLADAGYELVVNAAAPGGGTVLAADGPAAGLTVGGNYSFTVRAPGDASFKGALMRFSAVVGMMEAAVDELAQEQPDVCGFFPSLTHTDASDKTNITGMMTFDTLGPVDLLVDVVLYNNVSEGSSYAFSTYKIVVIGDETTVSNSTSAPIAAPTAETMMMPTSATMGGDVKIMVTNATVPPPVGNETTANNSTSAPIAAPTTETMMPSSANVSIGAIIGIACGGGVVVAMIVGFVWWRSCLGGFSNTALDPVAEPVYSATMEPVTVVAELIEPSAQAVPTFKDQMRAKQ
jgi:hypothetical protein